MCVYRENVEQKASQNTWYKNRALAKPRENQLAMNYDDHVRENGDPWVESQCFNM